jgi:hypothetical protein
MSEMVQPAAALPAVVPPRRRIRVRRMRWPRVVVGLAFAGSAIGYAMATPEQRAILGPALTVANAAMIFVLVLYRRDRRLPVFEIGTLWVFVAFMYSVFPLINFWAGGMHWTLLSDNRLLTSNPDAFETGRFAWRYAAYMVPFVIVYLAVRRRAHVPHTYMTPVYRSRAVSIVTIFIACQLFLIAISRLYGFSFRASYADIVAGQVQTMMVLPHFLLQIVSHVYQIHFFFIQLLMAICFRRWRSLKYRVAVFVFMGWEFAQTVLIKGSRGELILLMITAVLLYHRLVRQLTLKVALTAAAGIIVIFNILGVLRFGEITVLQDFDVPFLAAGNEFQTVFATSYDIWLRKHEGILPAPPPQLYFSDLYFMVPQQLLPFTKVDPSAWYLDVAGIENVGLMFGAVSQAIIGFDWAELILRGSLLGLLCALLHRWYVRRASRFWPTMLYLFLCVWTYYSMRQSSFAVLSFVEYWFLPSFLSVELMVLLLRRAQRGAVRLFR